jgi:2'-5' RNA ligase
MPALEGGRPERLFIGVPVPQRTSEELKRQLPKNLPGKVSPAENWHFTLKFLGSTEAVDRDRLIDEMRSASFGRQFDLTFDSLGAFPNERRARVLWLGVGKGRERLESIAASVESAARTAGFVAESRKFTAHLTLARIRPAESVVRLLAAPPKIDASMRLEEVIIYRSETGGSHSRYTIVERLRIQD